MKSHTSWLAASASILAFIIGALSIKGAGPLTPPGAPAPTMKTLEEIEPRTNLQASPTPPGVDTSDASYHYIITQPGSYYLSANLGVTKTHGIQINAERVTLDLNGFQISRSSGSGGDAIEISGTADLASVRNGSLKGFSFGISGSSLVRHCAIREINVSECTTYGIFAGTGAVLESCRAYNNSGTGIRAEAGSSLTNCSASYNSSSGIYIAGQGSVLSHCSASYNAGNYGLFASVGSSLINCAAYYNTATYGIYANVGSSLSNCSASGNTGTYGIYASSGSSLTNCTAYNNTSAATTSAGIYASGGSTVRGCSAYNNYSTAAVSTPTTGAGFLIGSGSVIQDCAAYYNEGDGIYFANDCLVRGNECNNNGFGGDGAGIHATSSDNRIEANNVSNNDRGIDVSGTGNVIMKNTAASNTINYEIVADNRYGQVIDITALGTAAVSGDSSAVNTISSTNPWANFAY